MKWIACLLATTLASAAVFAGDIAPPPLVSVAAITVTVEPGPTPLAIPPETSNGELRLHPRWTLTLDASGRVAGLEANDEAPVDAIRLPLENAIRSWHFTPGAIGGKPAETRTTLALDITLVERGDATFGVRVDDARTGADLTMKGFHHVVPKYPSDALRHRREGMVVLRIDYDGNGHVVGVRPNDGAPAVDASFVSSAETAVKRWTFSPEIVGGRGLAGSTIVPICFANYLHHKPSADSGCSWTPPAGHGGLGEGGIVAIDPAARLESDVVGHTL